MTHDPELMAGAYLAGELAGDERQSFEDHLLECDECWAEVNIGRRGQSAVESVRELAPSHLRATVRHSLVAGPRKHRHRRVLAVAATLVVAAGVTAGIVATRQPAESASITAAVAGYTANRLPGSAMPEIPAPDLSSLRLTEMGAGAGRIDNLAVSAYAYRDGGGRRLMIYMSKTPFPMPRRGHPLNGAEGPWVADHEGVAILCARHPHELLIVGEDDDLVHAAAEALDVM